MPDDDLPRAPARRRVAPRVRRLASPAGLIMVGLCLLLPFMSASCATSAQWEVPREQWEVTYTGVDIVAGGRPDVAFTDDADQKPIHTLDDVEVKQLLGTLPASLPPQPMAWLAAALMVAALAATALSSRTWRTTFTAGLAVAAAIVLWGATTLARHDAADAVAAVLIRAGDAPFGYPPTVTQVRNWEEYRHIRDMFRYDFGFWIAIVALAAVGVANTVVAGRGRVDDRDRPAGGS